MVNTYIYMHNHFHGLFSKFACISQLLLLLLLPLLVLGGIPESDSTHCNTHYHSMVCPSVSMYTCHLSHLCTLLKPRKERDVIWQRHLCVSSNTVLDRNQFAAVLPITTLLWHRQLYHFVGKMPQFLKPNRQCQSTESETSHLDCMGEKRNAAEPEPEINGGREKFTIQS